MKSRAKFAGLDIGQGLLHGFLHGIVLINLRTGNIVAVFRRIADG